MSGGGEGEGMDGIKKKVSNMIPLSPGMKIPYYAANLFPSP